MANEQILNPGTPIILQTAASSPLIADGNYHECSSAFRQPTDNPGYTLGIFELDTANPGFSGVPTLGAKLLIYERKINTASQDAPIPSQNYPNDYIGQFAIDLVNNQQFKPTDPLPIHRYGAKYSLYWEDGGAGNVSIDAGWELRLIPCAYGT